jgi:hypothetical protein
MARQSARSLSAIYYTPAMSELASDSRGAQLKKGAGRDRTEKSQQINDRETIVTAEKAVSRSELEKVTLQFSQ